MSKKRTIDLLSIYKIIFAIIILTGILDRVRLFSNEWQLHTLYSFTTIINFYILILVLISLFANKTISKIYTINISILQPLGIVLITVVAIVYHFILLPQKTSQNPNYNVFTYGNIVAHYVVPVITFINWILFCKKGCINKCFPLICGLIPLIYFVIGSIYGYLTYNVNNKKSSYVYFFMDYSKLGFIGVMKWAFIILLFILSISLIVYFIDAKSSKCK